MDDIPVLLPPELTPPLTTDDDLHRQWRAIMGRPRQSHRTAWFMLLHTDGRPTGVISQVTDLAHHPESEVVRNLIELFDNLLGGIDPGGSAAVLMTRPGWAAPHAGDLAWATDFADEARTRGVNLRTTFLATDEGVTPLRPARGVSDAA